MKKTLILITVMAITLTTSCKKGNSWFGKSSKKQNEIALLAKKNSELQQQLKEDSLRFAKELASIKSQYENKLSTLQQDVESGNAEESNVYYVVVGSFKNMKYAENYSRKVKSMGHEGKIVDGPSNFHLVTYGTYNSLRNSLSALKNARSGVAVESWVYFNK
ncbi:MAG TPA: SPOR domain-containing protein [Bacteroidales bacterium]|nr:SPOR domain-containing protein [Bacteroidales bacterium]